MDIKIGDTVGVYKVAGIKTIVHGPLFPNKNITHVLALKGKRTARGMAYLNRAGQVGKFISHFGYFEGEHILDGQG